MNAHELANEMTEIEADNVIAYWKENELNKLSEMGSLLNLGDSKKLAVATIMTKTNCDNTSYKEAYYS